MSKASERLHAALMDIPARVGRVVHLRTMLVDGTCAFDAEDIFGNLDDDDLKRFWPKMPDADRAAFLSGDIEKMEEIIDEQKLFGFLVRVETPVVRKNGVYSWGYYNALFFYADTFDAALRLGRAWAIAAHGEGAA